jgi:hypothetical protein
MSLFIACLPPDAFLQTHRKKSFIWNSFICFPLVCSELYNDENKTKIAKTNLSLCW